MWNNSSEEWNPSSRPLTHTPSRSEAQDMTEFLETPILIYNANPYLETVVSEPDEAADGFPDEDDTQRESSTSLTCKRRMKNGCLEYVDRKTGQRVVYYARDRSLSMMHSTDHTNDHTPSASVTPTELTQHSAFNRNFPLERLNHVEHAQNGSTELVLKRTEPMCISPGIDDHDTLFQTDLLAQRNCVALGQSNVPNFLPPSSLPSMESEIGSDSFFYPNRRTKHRENICPFEDSEFFGRTITQGPAVGSNRPLQRFNVLNKEVIHKRIGHNGQSSNVEKVRVEMDSLEDGYKWRKYGRKAVKGNTHPRSYFKCTYPECMCRKQVEQSPKNPKVLIATYEGRHIHPPPFLTNLNR